MPPEYKNLEEHWKIFLHNKHDAQPSIDICHEVFVDGKTISSETIIGSPDNQISMLRIVNILSNIFTKVNEKSLPECKMLYLIGKVAL